MKKAGIIYVVFRHGNQIRQELDSLSKERSEQTEYASSGNKRAAGIAHRLLNAAKAGNKQQFLDTVIRLYLQVKMPVPSLLLNVLHEKDMDFATLSGAFITGLLSDTDYTAVNKTEQLEQQTVQPVNP